MTIEPDNHLRINLRYLFNLDASIAATARQINMNRQQINKYLNGTSVPSVRNLQKICTHFSVDENEIFFKPAEFLALYELRGKQTFLPKDILETLLSLRSIVSTDEARLQSYCGIYFRYCYADDRKICKSVEIIFQKESLTYSRGIMILPQNGAENRTSSVAKSDALVLLLGERLYFFEAKDLIRPNANLKMTICYPSYSPAIADMAGHVLKVSDMGARNILNSPVFYEYIGPDRVRPSHLQQCGTYSVNDTAISPKIRDYFV